MIAPPDGMRNGGGGAVIETLVVLTTVGAAALSALAVLWRGVAKNRSIPHGAGEGDGEDGSNTEKHSHDG